MNLRIGNTKVTRNSIKAQYVSLACGLAVVASAVVAFGCSASQTSTTVQAAPSPTIARVPLHTTSPVQVASYLVADQAQADKARALEEQAQWVRYAASVAEPHRWVIVLRAGTREEAAQAEHSMEGAMAFANFSDGDPAPRFEIIDLR